MYFSSFFVLGELQRGGKCGALLVLLVKWCEAMSFAGGSLVLTSSVD